MKKNIKVLDCTFRDGGYYNNWKFDKKTIIEYIKAINNSNIDVVEIGFRFLQKKSLFGPFAYSNDNFIRKLKFKKKIEIAIMVNASDVLKLSENMSFNKISEKFFLIKKRSKIKYIRFAVHFLEIPKILPFLKIINKIGYKVIINLMQSTNKKFSEFKIVLDKLKNLKFIKVLYFADSLGSMDPEEVIRISNYLKKNWLKEIGIHAHDNCGNAIKNSLTAIDNGVTWIDCTIQGMGRGAGNAQTEILLTELQNKKIWKYNLKPIYQLAQDRFENLKKKYNWGKSLYYYMAAKNNIHPTYIQTLNEENKYSSLDKIEIIENLKKINPSSFDKNFLENYYNKIKYSNGDWNAKNWCENKDVLIIGQGPSIKKYNEQICNFIKKKRVKTLCLNINQLIPKNLVTYYVASHQERILLDFPKYKELTRPLIIPKNLYKDLIPKQVYKKIKNYGLVQQSNKFNANKNFCVLYSKLVIAYALAICKIGRAKKILLAGFDGYDDNAFKNDEMINLIKFFTNKNKKIKLNTLTPSIYPIKKINF